ncbi:MAG: GNAT family N-acetyltransferase [Casimicrobiaceae bacterium]
MGIDVDDGLGYARVPASAWGLRCATLEDAPVLEALIEESVRALCRGHYSDAQIDGALGTAFGLDRELIADRTYFVAATAEAVVGCGGWSRRRTLFGGDRQPGRVSALLDPAVDAARVRAFFVKPAWARRGIGRALIERCEAEARAHGFKAIELMATLPGHALYRAMGYAGDARQEHVLPGGVPIAFIPMRRVLA